MKITISHLYDIPALCLECRLDQKVASAFDETLSTLPDVHHYFVLDTQGVDYLPSVGILSLLKWEKTLRQRSGGILLCAVTPGVSQILCVAGDVYLGAYPRAEFFCG